MKRSRIAFLFLLVIAAPRTAYTHEIPNARVDRSIQATVRPGRLTIDYEVSLSELTLLQDLRALGEASTNADSRALFDQYGKLTGPLNAKGLLVVVEGEPRVLELSGYNLNVEEHPRFTFHFTIELPPRGRLRIKDTNYESSEGTSRLAIKGRDGVRIQGDDLPSDVALIPIRPVWQLSNDEERRTRQVDVTFEPGVVVTSHPEKPAPLPSRRPTDRLMRLLDRSSASVTALWLIALTMGAAHAIQPGHGKTLVAAAALGASGGWWRGPALALTITVAHFSGVLALALILWASQSSRYPEIQRGLAQTAGFVIAAIGFWRLGRHLGGHETHHVEESFAPTSSDLRGLLAIGLAGGAVPCWDAVILILLAGALGRLALGLALLTAFSLGMGVVLVAVGLIAARFRRVIQQRDAEGKWARRVGILSAGAVAGIGLYLLSES